MPGKFNAPKTPKIVARCHVTAAWAHRCEACGAPILAGTRFARMDTVEANGHEAHIKACTTCEPAVASQYQDVA